MAGWTNRGKKNAMAEYFLGTALASNTAMSASSMGKGYSEKFYVALITNETAPGADINKFDELEQIATGNGYESGGYAVNADSTDFDTITEDDGSDRGLVQLKDIVWTASGGTLPSSGNGAYYCVLLTDTSIVRAREVLAYWTLGATAQSVSDTQSLTVQNIELRLDES